MNPDHLLIRKTSVWGTYGKLGDEPLRFIIIKDITNDHLLRIIPFIKRNPRSYNDKILQVMMDELEYRTVNHINVPFIFGR